MKRTYLDHNATSPLVPEALEAMMPFLKDGAANPSSVHRDGQRARLAIEEAREDVAMLVQVAPSEVVFTSGGTESANTAITGAALARLADGTVSFPSSASIVSTTLEHPAVHRALRGLEQRGLRVVRIAPRPEGIVEACEVLAAIGEGTLLVSVMSVNNEIGTVQPVETIADACADRGILFHSDAVQALGRTALPASAALLSLSAHKIGGPQGVGALIVRKRVSLAPLIRGGPQELRRRAGTENTAGIAGFGAAARLARVRLSEYPRQVGRLKERLEAGLRTRVPGVVIHGESAPRAANTSCFALPEAEGVGLQIALDLLGFSVSTGTACASGKTATSYVLRALGLPEDLARGSIRVSFGWTNTPDDVDRFLDALLRAYATVQGSARPASSKLTRKLATLRAGPADGPAGDGIPLAAYSGTSEDARHTHGHRANDPEDGGVPKSFSRRGFSRTEPL